MRQITKLTANPSQRYILVTEAGDFVSLSLRFLPSQQSWQASIVWGSKTIDGITLTLSPNILFGYKNVLPFGIMVAATNSIEPSYLDDFTTGRVKLYLMTQTEVAELDAGLSA